MLVFVLKNNDPTPISEVIAGQIISVYVIVQLDRTITEVIFIFNCKCDYPKIVILQTESFMIGYKHENSHLVEMV